MLQGFDLRRDLFLHFLNRDTREVFGLYTTLSNDAHAGLLRRALNAAIMLCEDRCVAPPGFVVEDQIAFLLAENQGAFLREGLIQLPMRESSLAEFAEKKRIGYQPMRDRYSGLFSDTRIGFLGDNATGIIRRKTHITEGILRDWSTGAEAGKKIWKPVKNLLKPAGIDLVAKIPLILDQRGTAVTWAAIQPELPSAASAAKVELRNTLQHIYFKQYCDEFRLCALTGIPYIQHDFDIPCDARAYNFRRLGAFLEIFDLRDILFDAPADLLVALRRRPGFIAFMDAFVALSSTCKTETDLKFFSGQARAAVRFGWPKNRRPSVWQGPLASADEVVASDDWRKNILTGKGGDPKLLGVEMEAGGVCAAARKFNVPVSMLRVISDQADPSKADDNWRKLGMATLADLLKSIGIAHVLEAIG